MMRSSSSFSKLAQPRRKIGDAIDVSFLSDGHDSSYMQQRARVHSSSYDQNGSRELRHFSSYTADEKDLQYFGKKKQTSVNLKALLETARGDRY